MAQARRDRQHTAGADRGGAHHRAIRRKRDDHARGVDLALRGAADESISTYRPQRSDGSALSRRSAAAAKHRHYGTNLRYAAHYPAARGGHRTERRRHGAWAPAAGWDA